MKHLYEASDIKTKVIFSEVLTGLPRYICLCVPLKARTIISLALLFITEKCQHSGADILRNVTDKGFVLLTSLRDTMPLEISVIIKPSNLHLTELYHILLEASDSRELSSDGLNY